MNRPEDEEKYEAGLDNHGCWGGPKSGRLRGLQNVSENIFNQKLSFWWCLQNVGEYI